MCKQSFAFIVAAMMVSAVPVRAQIEPNQQAIADVGAGKIKEAKASWWGFDPEDATQSLQAAINSGVPKLTVDDVGQPWIVTPITLVSDQEIVFEEGVEVVAKRGEFKSRNASLFSASNKENITLSGYGATWRMWREDYDNPELYERAEWRMCLGIRGCTNVKVLGLTLTESGGDGIYLGAGAGRATNTDIVIKDVTCDRNYRQGISVITAENLLIENTIMRETGGTPPRAGIDFEPNHPEERLVNCVMRDCISENNEGCGYVLAISPLNATSEPVSLRFENCRGIGNGGTAFALKTGDTLDGAVDGTIDLESCVLQSARSACFSVAKPCERCQVTLTDCSILAAEEGVPQPALIVFGSGRDADHPVGGVEFASCLVRDSVDRVPMAYVDRGAGIPLQDITGTLILEKNGERTEVTLTEELLAEWLPVTAVKFIPRLSLEGVALKPLVADAPAEKYAFGFAMVRRTGRFLLYAAEGEEVTFTVDHVQVGRYAGKPVNVVITAPSGEEAHRASAPFKEQTEVSFTAPETGVYRITADPAQNRLRVTTSSHPINLTVEGGVMRLIGAGGDYSFWVPAGTTEFGVRVGGEGTGEAIRAMLINPAGEVVDEVDNNIQTRQFEVTLDKPSEGEVWTLRLAKPTEMSWEDHYVDLRGVPPILAPSREALLVPVP